MVLYRLGVRFYTLAIQLAAAFNPKARLWVDGRKGWKQKLKAGLEPDRPVIWMHSASLGEFEQGKPVLEALAAEFPQHQVLVTFFSPSGYEARKQYKGAQFVSYLPADLGSNPTQFLSIVQPALAVFVKYEFWLGYLRAMRQRHIPHVVIAANFRPDQVFFKWYGKRFLRALAGFDHLFVQRTDSATLLKEHGIDRVSVCGDTRFDRVWATVEGAEEIDALEAFSIGDRVLVAGSTWAKEEALLIHFMRQSDHNLKYIIAPHEIDEDHIEQLISHIPFPAVRYFKSTPEEIAKARVVVIDGIGVLSRAYRYGHVALVGGGFGKGIHNILEAATFGMPVFFGPNHEKFPEAGEMMEVGCGMEVKDEQDLTRQLNDLISDRAAWKTKSRRAREYVQQHRGATDQIVQKLQSLLKP